MVAAPAAAQSAQPLQVPPQLSDPRLIDQMTRMTQALGGALLNLPIGELEAAAEGRQPTAADRRRTVRDTASKDDPNFERNLQQQLANSRPIMESSMKALSAALPAMLQGFEQARQGLERAATSMPSPTYPKR